MPVKSPAKTSPTQHFDQSLLRRHLAAAAFENECDIPNDLVILPEPERMVSKIINKCFDDAWNTLIRTHPELQYDAYGNRINLKRNYLLEETFSHSQMRELPVHLSGMAEANGLVYTVDTNGQFAVSAADTMETIISKDYYDPPPPPVDPTAPPAATPAAPAAATAANALPTEPPMKQISNLIIGPTLNMPTGILDRHTNNTNSISGNFHTRLVVYGLVSISLPKPGKAGEKPKAPPAPAKGQPPKPINPADYEDQFIKYRIFIIDVMRVVNFVGQPQLSIHTVADLVLDNYMLVPGFDLQKMLYDEIAVSLSVDGLVLTVATQGTSGSYRVYALPALGKTFCQDHPSHHSTLEAAAAAASMAPPVAPVAATAAAAAPVKATPTAAAATLPPIAPPVTEGPPLVGFEPLLLVQLEPTSPLLRNQKVQQFIVIPPNLHANRAGQDKVTAVPPTVAGTSASQASLSSTAGNKATPKAGGGGVGVPSVGSRSQPNSARQLPGSGRPGSGSKTRPRGASESGPDLSKPKDNPGVVDFEKLTLAILYRDSCVWNIHALRRKPKPVEIVDPKAKAPPPAAAAAKGAAPVPEAPVPLYDLYTLNEWTLTAPVTSHATDSVNQLLVLGLRDGGVLLWNLLDRVMVGVLGRHTAPVSHLLLIADESQSDYHCVSAATDGVLCFYSTKNSGGSSSSSGAAKRSIETMKLKDYRDDFPGNVCILSLQISKTKSSSSSGNPASGVASSYHFPYSTAPQAPFPLMLVQYSDGNIALYNYKTASLCGKIENTIKLPQGQVVVPMHLLTHIDLPKVTDRPVPVEEVPVVEPPVDPKKAAPAGKGAAAAVPVIEVPPEPVEEKVPSPRIFPISDRSVVRGLIESRSQPVSFFHNISILTKNYFHCVYIYDNVPQLFSFSVDRMVKGKGALKSLAELGSEVPNTVTPEGLNLLNGTAAVGGANMTTSSNTVTGKKSASESVTSGQLRLTEERLHALELSFHSTNDKASAVPVLPAIKIAKNEVNVRQIVQKDVLKSKLEREGRKTNLARSIKDLGSYL